MRNNNLARNIPFHPQGTTRQGAVVVMVAILLLALLGCVALAVDIWYLYVARTELQRAADSAALAGAQALGRDSESPFGEFLSSSNIYIQANLLGQQNTCIGQSVMLHWGSDIEVGYLQDPRDRNAVWQTLPLNQCNAVKVIARRDSSNSRGKIPLFFGPLLGVDSSDVSASAIAVLDARFYAYSPKTIGGAGAMPFAMDEQVWNDEIVAGNGQDIYSFDDLSGSPIQSPDGIPETKLFPDKVNDNDDDNGNGNGNGNNGNGNGNGNGNNGGSGNSDGAGNFGILHIGSGSLGVPTLREQIRNGISKDDFVDLTGKPMIEFHNYDSGAVVSYDILGDPGIKAGMKDAITEKVGKKVGFFLYSTVVKSGSNATFTIVGMRFARVMEVDLTGSANSGKAIILQPVSHYGPDILTSPNAPSTDRQMGSLELVR